MIATLMGVGGFCVVVSLLSDNIGWRTFSIVLGMLCLMGGSTIAGYEAPIVTEEPLVPTIDTTYTTDGVTIDTVLTYTYKR